MKSILDPSFQYTASFNTDLKKTFARIRREHRNDAERAAQATANAPANVSSIVRKTATGPMMQHVLPAGSGLSNRRTENA
jgi:hypothetical protein